MKYYLNTEPREDGTQVMHAEHCQFLPGADKRKSLGDYANCDTGLRHARDETAEAKPCGTCCSACSD